MGTTSSERLQELIDIEYEKALEDILSRDSEVEPLIEAIASDLARLYVLHRKRQKFFCQSMLQQIDTAVREEADLRAREVVYE